MRKDEPFELSAELGRPGVVIFFLDTCQHCHQALRFLKEALAQIPEDERPFLIGVSVRNRPYAVASALKETGLDFFDVVFDPDYAIRDAYGVVAGVPDIFVIDPEGRIAARVRGWNEARDPALMRMWLAEVSGQPVPMLLHTTGYSGNEACAVCHPQEYETWQLTQHAGAYNTLVRHGADQNEECVSCHVVGWGQPGGYEPGPLGRHLENVGCESCHGRGGPHLSPSFVKDGNYEGVCRTCHDPKHSLGFEYATFLPQISHAANAPLLQLPPEQRERILAERGGPRSDLLPTQARYVGSEACRSCHEAEYATWAQSGHAKSLHSLEAKGEASNAECLACHTTAMGRNGGFPKDGKPADHADLARVGCESCHGPGGDHVGVDSTRIGTIVSLGDKCDSCVILQICGTCHDDANDPGFEFEVEAKIEAQRHGTIEPAASRQPASVGSRAMPRDTDLVAHGFARRDSQQ
jgi:peroxiredoxin